VKRTSSSLQLGSVRPRYMRKPKTCAFKDRLYVTEEMKGFLGWLVLCDHVNLYVPVFGGRKRIEDFTAFDEREVAIDLLLQNEQMFGVPLKVVRDDEVRDPRFLVNVCNVYN
jgi:hypothetical protein